MHGVRNPESVGLAAAVHHVAAEVVRFAEIVGIPPAVGFILPVSGRRILHVVRSQTGSVKRIGILLDPSRIVTVLLVIGNQVVYTSRFTLRIGPLHVHLFAGGTVVGDGVVLNRPLLAGVASAQFVPLVVGQGVSVDVLHDPDDARLRRAVESVALNREVVFALRRRPFGNAVVESHDDITAESAERHPDLLFQTPLGIGDGRLLRRLRAVESARFHFADELSRGGRIFIYLVPQRRISSRGRTVAVFLHGIETGYFHLSRECRFSAGDVAGKTFCPLFRFAHRNPDDMFARFGRRIPEHALHGVGNRFAVHAPRELRIVEILQQRFEENRRADISIAIRRCAKDGLRGKENLVGQFVHDLDRNLLRRLAVDVRSAADDHIGAELRLVERIGHAFGHDLALAQPLAPESLQVGVLNVGRKDIVRVLQDFQPLRRQNQRNDRRSHLQHLHLQLLFGFAVFILHRERYVHLGRFIPCIGQHRLRGEQFPVRRP